MKQINAASQVLGLNPKGTERFLIDISKLFRSVNINFEFNPKDNLKNLINQSQALNELFNIESQIFMTIYEDYILEDNFKSIAECYLSVEDRKVLLVHDYSALTKPDENETKRIVESGSYIMDVLILNSFEHQNIVLNPNVLYEFYKNQTEINELYIENTLKSRNLPPMKQVFLDESGRNELKDLVKLWKIAFKRTFDEPSDDAKTMKIWSFETATLPNQEYTDAYQTYFENLMEKKEQDDTYFDSSDEDYSPDK